MLDVIVMQMRKVNEKKSAVGAHFSHKYFNFDRCYQLSLLTKTFICPAVCPYISRAKSLASEENWDEGSKNSPGPYWEVTPGTFHCGMAGPART